MTSIEQRKRSSSTQTSTSNIKTNMEYLNQLEEYILIALAGQERYGLEIIEILEKNSNSRISPSIGTLYPTLQRLELKNCITSRMETASGESRARRKYFKITQNGLRHLAEIDRFRSSIYAHQA
jgi:DNA-binding PadR family transcriptional regulator